MLGINDNQTDPGRWELMFLKNRAGGRRLCPAGLRVLVRGKVTIPLVLLSGRFYAKNGALTPILQTSILHKPRKHRRLCPARTARFPRHRLCSRG